MQKNLPVTLMLFLLVGSYAKADLDYDAITAKYFDQQVGKIAHSDYEKCVAQKPQLEFGAVVGETDLINVTCPEVGAEIPMSSSMTEGLKAMVVTACKGLTPGDKYKVKVVPDVRNMFNDEGVFDIGLQKEKDRRFCLYTNKNMQCFKVPISIVKENKDSQVLIELGDRKIPLSFHVTDFKIDDGLFLWLRSPTLFRSNKEMKAVEEDINNTMKFSKKAQEKSATEGSSSLPNKKTTFSPMFFRAYWNKVTSNFETVQEQIPISEAPASRVSPSKINSLNLEDVSQKEAEKILEMSALAHIKLAKGNKNFYDVIRTEKATSETISACTQYAQNKPALQRALCNLLKSNWTTKCPFKQNATGESQDLAPPSHQTGKQ